MTWHRGNMMIVATVLLSLSLSAQNAEEILSKKLKKFSLEPDKLGAVISVGVGEQTKIILSQNADKKMIPASLTKITTSSAVLSHFLPGSKFKTQVFLDKKPESRSVKGPLYLKGGGDPSFVSENMWFLVNSFTRNKVEVIEGDIVVDDSLFDAVRFDESREAARVDRAYDAPVGAMSFNWNSINVYVRPGKKGEKADVFLDPDNGYTKLDNKTKTTSGSKVDIRVSREKDGEKDVLIVAGSIGDEASEHVIYKNITRPELWSGLQLKSFLSQRGIQVKGKVRTGKVPASAFLAAEAESKPIEDVLADMNKFSNNFVAEMLTKNLGLTKKQPGTIESGMDVIREHMLSLGISKDEFELYNPSGLTRDNKMTPKALWKVLKHLLEDYRVQPEFLKSLPIAGIDGTLKKRMKDSPAERFVRAKTGLLTSIAALGGYAGRKDGTTLTFVLIYNGAEEEAKVRQFYDDVLIELVK